MYVNQDFSLQPTEMKSGEFRKKRDLLKGFWKAHRAREGLENGSKAYVARNNT